jgi:hypothetical protein
MALCALGLLLLALASLSLTRMSLRMSLARERF